MRHYGLLLTNRLPIILFKYETRVCATRGNSTFSCHLNCRLLKGDIITWNTRSFLKRSYSTNQRISPLFKRSVRSIQNNINGSSPNPVSIFHQVYDIVGKCLGPSHKIDYESTHIIEKGADGLTWKCIISVTWPSSKTVVGSGHSKKESCKLATTEILSWLHDQRKITDRGFPILMDKKFEEDASRVFARLADSDSSALTELISHYEESGVQSILQEKLNSVPLLLEDEQENSDLDHLLRDYRNPVLYAPLSEIEKSSDLAFSKRNNVLHSRAMTRKKQLHRAKGADALPIEEFRDDIVSLVNDNRVVVIAGHTGCGKSTQIPSFIFDEWALRMKGTDVNIVITQPRRISAISLAERIASEYSENVGDVVGYKVRFLQKLPAAPGAMLFLSTGMLLLQFRRNPGLFGCSHVIIDEAHERDIDIDLLLLLLKNAIKLNPKLHIVIMSATLNPEIFSKYFDDAPILEIPGKMFPVQSTFLSESSFGSGGSDVNEEVFVPSPESIASLVQHINATKSPGAILCFLTGWLDITAVEKCLSGDDSLIVLPLHSKISPGDQFKVFENAPPGKRKVILSTNIAETSITINDVVYIIETGLQKQTKWVGTANSVSLDVDWISKANVNQRKGRAGRTRPGECYHLYSESKYNSLIAYPIPDIHKMPLVKLVLDCKNLSNEGAKDFLSKLIEPPAVEAIDKAVEELISLKALDKQENLTALGERMSFLPMHPQLSKALIHSVILRCLPPVLNIVVSLSSENKMYELTRTRTERKHLKQKFSLSSDHIADHRIYTAFAELKSPEDLKEFCSSNGLNESGLDHFQRVKNLYRENLWESSIVDARKHLRFYDQPTENSELVKAIFLSGVGNIMRHRSFVMDGFKLRHAFESNNYQVIIANDSVNEDFEGKPSPFLTFYSTYFAPDESCMLVRDCSVVSPISVILFHPDEVSMIEEIRDGSKMAVLTIANQNIHCSVNDAKLLQDFRRIISDVLQFLIIEEGRVTDADNYDKVISFRDELISVLSSILMKEGERIESFLFQKHSKIMKEGNENSSCSP